MNRPLCYIGASLVWILLAVSGLQASDSLMVRLLFDQQDSLHWMREYQGLFNGKHPVRFLIASNGKAVRGLSHYQQSNSRYILRGRIQQDQWYLEEQDDLFRSSAVLIGQESEYSLFLDWHTLDQKRGGWLELARSSRKKLAPIQCQQMFYGSFSGQPASLYWQVAENRNIRGHLYLASTRKHYRVSGKLLDQSGAFQAIFEDQYLQKQGDLNGHFQVQKRFTCRILPNDKQAQTVVFQSVGKLAKATRYELDFLSQVEIEYPQLNGEPAFNLYIRQLLFDEFAQIRDHRKEVLKNLFHFDDDQRHQLNSQSWFEIFHLKDGLISGIITIGHSWDSSYRSIPFNFDLNRKQPIPLNTHEFGTEILDELIKKAINQLEQKSAMASFLPFQEWIQGTDWALENFCNSGLWIHTAYHPAFGRQRLLIPFAEIHHLFAENNPLNALAK